jgi:hypothetical protein
MTESNQTREAIDRARAYLADIRAGHVIADEGAPFATLTSHASALLDIIDEQWISYPAPEGEQAQLRAELLAQVPASLRDYALSGAVATDLSRHPGDTIQTVTDWLRAARREAPAPEAAGALTTLAAWMDAQLEDEAASRQYIAEHAAARIREVALQLGIPADSVAVDITPAGDGAAGHAVAAEAIEADPEGDAR